MEPGNQSFHPQHNIPRSNRKDPKAKDPTSQIPVYSLWRQCHGVLFGTSWCPTRGMPHCPRPFAGLPSDTVGRGVGAPGNDALPHMGGPDRPMFCVWGCGEGSGGREAELRGRSGVGKLIRAHGKRGCDAEAVLRVEGCFFTCTVTHAHGL